MAKVELEKMFQNLGAADDPRQARPRVRAGPDKEQTLDILTLVVGSEPGTLGQDRLELEGGAEVGVELVLEVQGSEDPAGDEMRPQVRHQVLFFQRGEDAVGVFVLDRIPVL